jgi:hypothetical protein
LPEQTAGFCLGHDELVELLELGGMAQLSTTHFIEGVHCVLFRVPEHWRRHFMRKRRVALDLSQVFLQLAPSPVSVRVDAVDPKGYVKRVLEFQQKCFELIFPQDTAASVIHLEDWVRL